MRRLGILAGTAALASALVLAGPAQAAPLAPGSTLSLNGSDSYTSTSITFVNPANIGGETGSFAVLTGCTGCVTMISSFNTGTATPFTMYTATEGAVTTSLSVNTDSFSFSGTGPSLTVTGTGVLSLTGFTPTPGTFILTTQGPTSASVTFSVSSTASAVPEPASLALFGTALAGLGLLARRRRKNV